MKFGRKKDNSEVKFSWFNVVRRWGKNLKDDVDPALTGAKWGVYGIHAIPTVHRELKEGKMRSERPFLSKSMGFITGATEVAGYWFASQHFNAQLDSDYMGYAVLGVPLVANGVSWVSEAFRSAKKTERGNVIMTRLRKSLEDTSSGEYDLTNKDLVTRLSTDVPRGSDLLEEGITGPLSKEQTKQYIMDVTGDIFEGLAADGRVGRKYDLTEQLHTGPAAMKIRTDKGGYRHRFRDRKDTEKLAEVVRKTVDDHNGNADIELLGNVTAVYSPQDSHVQYLVKPNRLWR